MESSCKYPLQLSSVSEEYAAQYEESLKNPEQFWGHLARTRLRWIKEFDQVMDCDMNKGSFKWFQGGVINVSENCLDRHAERNPDKAALIWEKDEPGEQEVVSYSTLLDMTCQVANVLKKDGVKKGDRVAIYMPVSPLLVAAMLACARIGAIHSIVFGGFSAESLGSRIIDGSCSVVFTADQGVRGGKVIPLKQTVDEALKGCDCVRRVFVARRTGAKVPFTEGRDVWLDEAMSQESTVCPPEPLDSEDILFMLYTSGSTGKPKGIVHTQAGYLLYASMTQQYAFDFRSESDVFACVADIGWITGHSYVVYGPLCNGGTTVLFESHPIYPNPGRYWEMVERLKITHFYTAPTAIRLLIKYGDDWVTKYNRSTLRILGCVGEPLNREAWLWYNNVVGREKCTVVDTYWQTETGGITITPRPGPDNSPPKPGFPTRPFWGMEPALLSLENEVQHGPDVSGHLCFKRPWPGIARTIWGSHEAYLRIYFEPHPGYYFTGDGALRDKENDYRITGRVDDMLNSKGHRLGTAELECAMNHEPQVAETAVVGYPHEIFGEGIMAFVILKSDVEIKDKDIVGSLKELVKKKIAAFAIPTAFLVVPGLPKTRSGKIMRRVLRKIAADKASELGDVSTLADPSIVKQIVEIYKTKLIET
ncbi:acetyl-coenzyme A synthetase 2-like, mitochondrial [Halichondria panicea]|uniref:acetyl-coenzyme A synthetase 2-like, mitochondrial n=1 Tax=Halichondria panicea TaxID=6063 RepID=UPI00312B9EB1